MRSLFHLAAIVVVALSASLPTSADAAPVGADDASLSPDRFVAVHDPIAGGSIGAAEISVPDDAAKYTLLVITPAHDRTVRSWFETNPQLNHLARSLDWYEMTDNSKAYTARWRSGMSWKDHCQSLPAVIVQAPATGDEKGPLLFKVSGENMPRSSAELAQVLAASLQVEAGAWNCPDCYPQKPRPKPIEPPKPLPDQYVTPASPDCPDGNCPTVSVLNPWSFMGIVAGIIVLGCIVYVVWQE